MSRNCLNIEKRDRLLNWMRLNHAHLETISRRDAAKKATEELGFPVTETNCTGLQSITGVKFARQARDPNKPKRKRKATAEQKIELLFLTIKSMSNILHALTLSHAKLSKELGVKLDVQLDDLAENLRLQAESDTRVQ
jgi:hypothetical protein